MSDVRAEEKKKKKVIVLLNVIMTLNAEISSLFYLNPSVYNLTAYYSTTTKMYCALWTEAMAGSDIASVFCKILDVVVEENDMSDAVTWSDSCIPQNWNSIISKALLYFVRDNPRIRAAFLFMHFQVQEYYRVILKSF